MHQLAVTGKRAADVVVLICGQELRVHRIERDEPLIRQLIDLEQSFWAYVQADRAPPADGSDSADTALRALFAQDNGQPLDLSGDLEMAAVFSDLLAVRQALETQGRLEAQLVQRIQQRMGEASIAQFERGLVRWKRSRESQRLDLDRLRAEQPALVQRYSVNKPGARRFMVQTDD